MVRIVVVTLVDDVDVAVSTDDHLEPFKLCSFLRNRLTDCVVYFHCCLSGQHRGPVPAGPHFPVRQYLSAY